MSTCYLEQINFYESSQAVEIVESIGGKINAFTTKEYVCVYSKVLSENTGKLIQVLFNLIMYPSFEDRDIESEKKLSLMRFIIMKIDIMKDVKII